MVGSKLVWLSFLRREVSFVDFEDMIKDDVSEIQWLLLPCRNFSVKEVLISVS